MAKNQPTAPEAAEPDADQAALDLTPVQVRVLTACSHGNANDLAVLPACQIATAKADSLVDDDPAAVAYAKSLAAGSGDSDNVL